MTACPRLNSWIRGCRFEPRYDEGEPLDGRVNVNGRPTEDVVRIIKSTKPKTYVRDVCTTCGRTIEREGN